MRLLQTHSSVYLVFKCTGKTEMQKVMMAGGFFTEYMTAFTLLAARVTCQDNYPVNLKSFISCIVVYILFYVYHAFLRIHILTYGTCMCTYYYL